jgi:uncharacterized protein (DUF427 family)
VPERSEAYRAEQDKWRKVARSRPADIIAPGPGRESVWGYPSPPRVEPVTPTVRVELEGRAIADTTRALRVCETASPPCYYIPPADILMEHLEPSARTSFCEWKGVASYWSVRVGGRYAKDAAWCYPDPDEGFDAIRDYIAFYPKRMDACWVGSERVTPQPGFYYGGWVTTDLVGPFKGVPGSEGW